MESFFSAASADSTAPRPEPLFRARSDGEERSDEERAFLAHGSKKAKTQSDFLGRKICPCILAACTRLHRCRADPLHESYNYVGVKECRRGLIPASEFSVHRQRPERRRLFCKVHDERTNRNYDIRRSVVHENAAAKLEEYMKRKKDGTGPSVAINFEEELRLHKERLYTLVHECQMQGRADGVPGDAVGIYVCFYSNRSTGPGISKVIGEEWACECYNAPANYREFKLQVPGDSSVVRRAEIKKYSRAHPLGQTYEDNKISAALETQLHQWLSRECNAHPGAASSPPKRAIGEPGWECYHSKNGGGGTTGPSSYSGVAVLLFKFVDGQYPMGWYMKSRPTAWYNKWAASMAAPPLASAVPEQQQQPQPPRTRSTTN